ncbi:MAG: pyridoxal phosphate-dependent aminotransferase [bacterium]
MAEQQRWVARAVKELMPSKIREMSLRASGLKGVISLGIGEPDFPTSQEVCRRALEDALAGATHYAPSQGDPELLAALRDYIQERYGISLQEENLLITSGGMGALTGFFRTVLNPGDEVLVPEPHFPEYRAHIELAGGKLVHVPTRLEDDYVPQPEQVEKALGSKSKVLLINSPNNPTGSVIPAGVMDRLASLAKEADLLVVCDEVYDRLVFDGHAHQSMVTRPGMSERTVVIGSFSKAFAMTGWRLGYAFGPAELIREMTKVVTYYTSCASSVSQRAGLAALRSGQALVEGMVAEFQKRRDLVYESLCQIPGIRVSRPAGAFYIFPNLESITQDTEEFAIRLLEQERVVVVPGEPFGPSGRSCVRMAFTVGMEDLGEAMKRFKRFALSFS